MKSFPLVAVLVTAVCCLPHVSTTSVLRAETGGTSIEGVVFVVDSSGERSMISDARVRIEGPAVLVETLTDPNGHYAFTGLAAGTYQIRASTSGLSGSATATVVAGTTKEVPIALKPEEVRQSMTVEGDAGNNLATSYPGQATIDRSAVIATPNKYDRFESLLPLVPGVVRGPDGLINMKGARSSQGGALLNNANVTDPATGNAALNLPIDVVVSVKVISNPYDAEYGRLAGAVSEVQTVTSNLDKFHLSIQNLFIRPRKRAGDFVGIESATPRFTVTGPILKDKIAFTQSLEYRFVRVPVSSLPKLERDIKLEGVNSFSQVDVNLSERQSLTASFALYPQKINYFGLNTFIPQLSTPDLHQRGYMAALQHRFAIGPDSILLSSFSYKRFDADITANSSDPFQLLIETTAGGYFNRQNRETWRTEWQETWQSGVRNFLGAHQLKAGLDYAHSDYDGRIELLPVAVFGLFTLPVERINFGPASRFDIHQNEIAVFVTDNWTTPWQRLTLSPGIRFDRDSITNATHAAPRAGFALLLTKDAKTVLRGGVGLFYDRVPLNIATFPLLPERTIVSLTPAGQIADSTTYRNVISDRLRNPRSVGWNVELDRQVTSALTVRGGFQERNTSRDFELTPERALNRGELSLSNSGRQFYREFQVEAAYRIRANSLSASYVRSRAFGDLNDFNQFFGNNATAVIQPNERGRLPFDAPNRFLFRGQFRAPMKLTVAPVFDIHTGFPWSVVNQYREFVGPRDSQRLPRFHSLDLQVTRPVTLPFRHRELKARVGVSVFNLLNHFNPRDVQNDLDSDRFEGLFNGVGRTFRGKFVLDF